MKTSFLVLGPLVALLLAPALFGGIRSFPHQTEPPKAPVGACKAEGAECIFGSAGGCQVYCEPGQKPECEGASCFLGFPRAAKCKCS